MDALLALVSRASQAICLLKLCSETDDFESVAAALPHETRVTLTQVRVYTFLLFCFSLLSAQNTHARKKKR
jgi:hypothetical protein